MKSNINSLKFVAVFILSQPIFDVVTFLAIYNNQDSGVITWIRFAFTILVGVYSVFLSKKEAWKIAIVSVYAVFGALQVAVRFQDGLTWLVNTGKLFLMPILSLALLAYGENDPSAYTKRVWRSLGVSCLIVYGVVLSSLITGTNYPTYAPWRNIGINGWFYSANGQSIIATTLCVFFLSILIANGSRWSLAGIPMVWLLLFFNGTRVSLYGLVFVLVVMLLLLLIQRFAGSYKPMSWPIAALLAVGIILTIVLYPYSPARLVMDQRQFEGDYSKSIDRPAPTIAQQTVAIPSALTTPNVQPSSIHTPDGSAAPKTVPTSIPTASSTQPILQPEPSGMDTPKVQAVTSVQAAIIEQYNKAVAAVSVEQRMDTRFRQQLFVRTAMKNAGMAEWLIGYGPKWLFQSVGFMETDYHLLLGAYGLLGVLVFFLPVAFILYKTISYILRSKLDFDMLCYYAALFLVLAIHFGAAYFSGRSLQQPSVSVYVSIILSLMYLGTKGEGASRVPAYRG